MLVSRTRHRTFQMVTCDTPIIPGISLRENPGSQNWTIFSIITGRILADMNTNLVWDGNLQTATAHNWMWSTKLWQLKKSAFPRKKLDSDWTKVIVDHKTLLEGRERYFIYCQGTAIRIDIDFHQLWSETITLAEWFHSVDKKYMN